MTKRLIAALLLMAMLLTGCGATVPEETTPATTAEPETVVTAPPLKSYTGEVNDDVVATIGEAMLTNRELQAWYWAEVAQYRQENHETAPDFDRPLDSQPCGIDDAAETWQEYFLWEAVDAWHTAQALMMQSREVPMPTEDVYRPSDNYHEHYLTGMPAARYLYGHNKYYQLNTLHEEYLNSLTEILEALATKKGYASVSDMAGKAFGTTEDALNSYADLYNQGYMYFTAMSYYLTQEEETQAAEVQGHFLTDIRHILLIPKETEEDHVVVAENGIVTCSENAWTACEEGAEALLDTLQWDNRNPEYVFSELAVKHSQDTGTALDGGAYHGLCQGQMMDALDAWCFDPVRQVGDTTIIRSEYGVHILYFSGSRAINDANTDEEIQYRALTSFIEEAKNTYAIEIDYSLVALSEAEATVAAGEILYPDIAHERYPEVPLYLQQDYPGVAYNAYTLAGNGCGITSMAMLASYMTDDELTPPEMCTRFGNYGYGGGTDGSLFTKEPSSMGFYLLERTHDYQIAKAALQEGHVVISLQYAGYWTRFGHYIVIESITEDDMIRVRDSNIFNYAKLADHKNDLHRWGTAVGNSQGFWIYEKKVTNIPACSRCGTEEAITDILLTEDYICHKCRTALLRRNAYLEN